MSIITNVSDFNPKHLSFTIEEKEYGKRVNILYKNIPLQINTRTKLFSTGIKEFKKNGKLDFRSFPLFLYDVEKGATEDQKALMKVLKEITLACKEFVLKNKKALKLNSVTLSDLKSMDLMKVHTNEDGAVDEKKSPCLFPKLLENQLKDVWTAFYSPDGSQIPYERVVGQACMVKTILKIESIWVGNKITIQVRVKEAVIYHVDRNVSKKSLILEDCPELPALVEASDDELSIEDENPMLKDA